MMFINLFTLQLACLRFVGRSFGTNLLTIFSPITCSLQLLIVPENPAESERYSRGQRRSGRTSTHYIMQVVRFLAACRALHGDTGCRTSTPWRYPRTLQAPVPPSSHPCVQGDLCKTINRLIDQGTCGGLLVCPFAAHGSRVTA